MRALTGPREKSQRIGKAKVAVGALATSLLVGFMAAPLPSANAAGESASLWTYPVPESVVMAVDSAREKAHQTLMDLPAWNATIRMGTLKDKTWVNTTLGSVKLNMYGNGTYKTSVQMPMGTRAQVYVGGKVITTTIRP